MRGRERAQARLRQLQESKKTGSNKKKGKGKGKKPGAGASPLDIARQERERSRAKQQRATRAGSSKERGKSREEDSAPHFVSWKSVVAADSKSSTEADEQRRKLRYGQGVRNMRAIASRAPGGDRDPSASSSAPGGPETASGPTHSSPFTFGFSLS